MAVSIREVAKAAGVSVSTVSRALNGYTDVNEETRKKIQRTVQELGYTPNKSAKNLSSKSKNNVALIISGFTGEDKLEEFIGNILRGVYEYALKNEVTVATYGIDSHMQQKKTLKDMCDEYSLSGIMLLGLRLDDPYLHEVGLLDIPCISIDTMIQGKNASFVTTDDTLAFEQITDYVLQRGHRKLVLVRGREKASVTHLRYNGFFKALERYHVRIEDVDVIDCDFREEMAYEATREYLQRNKKEKATAFICMSDLMALGVMRAIGECGYSVPNDFSVTGFDGLYVLNYMKLGLTTVEQNTCAKGYAGIKTLMNVLNGSEMPKKIYVPHKIVEGESVVNIKMY